MDELQQRSKLESKAFAKANRIGKDDNKEVTEFLQQEWEKTAKSAKELIKQNFTKF